MTEAEHIAEHLEARAVKPTANRIVILKELMHAGSPLSLTELETRLETLDKSSIFRAVTIFANKGVVHAIEDGSGQIKYEFCRGEEGCSIDDMHVHFHCERCHRTICFSEMPVPIVNLPDGFVKESVTYVIKGICDRCAAEDA